MFVYQRVDSCRPHMKNKEITQVQISWHDLNFIVSRQLSGSRPTKPHRFVGGSTFAGQLPFLVKPPMLLNGSSHSQLVPEFFWVVVHLRRRMRRCCCTLLLLPTPSRSHRWGDPRSHVLSSGDCPVECENWWLQLGLQETPRYPKYVSAFVGMNK